MINDLTFGMAVVIPVALAVYNIKVNNRSTKKRIIIISAVFVTVFAASFGLGLISNHNVKKYHTEYCTVAEDGLLGGCKYLGDEEGYHIISNSKLFNSNDLYAVPDSVELPVILKLSSGCNLYVPDEDEDYIGTVELPSHRSCTQLSENAVIKAAYFNIAFSGMIFSFIFFALYELIEAILSFTRNKSK